ncbi:MAG TPA: hypothetical protein VG755_29380 [Nannocystaceae bacterium]|nr:hypothetical protein [Nannocystaceae bacterium]
MKVRALLVCVALVVARPAAAQEPTEPTVEELERRAQIAFEAERYDEVVELAAQAYAKTGDVRHLYAQAHAERFRGNCKDALALYARVMAAEPDGLFGQHAREGIKLCEQTLGDERATPPEPKVAPTPPQPLPPPDRVQRRTVDPLGTALLSLGVASLAGAASLAALAGTHARRLDRARDEQTIVDERRRARAFEGAAIGVSVLGTGLVVGGIVRLVQRRRHRDH